MIAWRMAKSGYPKGMKRSEETCKRIADSQRGKIISEKHREAISKANKGIVRDDNFRMKVSESMKGREFSEEHKLNLSKSAKGNQNGRKVK
jgi:hypothetical protein